MGELYLPVLHPVLCTSQLIHIMKAIDTHNTHVSHIHTNIHIMKVIDTHNTHVTHIHTNIHTTHIHNYTHDSELTNKIVFPRNIFAVFIYIDKEYSQTLKTVKRINYDWKIVAAMKKKSMIILLTQN